MQRGRAEHIELETTSPQDKGTNFKEQITMVLRNSGFTTAKKVNVRSDMDVFDYPLPNHINLTPSVEKLEAAGIVGANAEHTIGACLNRFIADDELDNIRFWRGRALYVFGRIEYEDVFGDFHFTNFCLIAAWNEKGEFRLSMLLEGMMQTKIT